MNDKTGSFLTEFRNYDLLLGMERAFIITEDLAKVHGWNGNAAQFKYALDPGHGRRKGIDTGHVHHFAHLHHVDAIGSFDNAATGQVAHQSELDELEVIA